MLSIRCEALKPSSDEFRRAGGQEQLDAVQQGVCAAEGADLAMKLGLNYPAGPFEWLAGWDANAVVALLDRLDSHYRGERYRVSPELRQRASAPGRRGSSAER